MKPQCKETAEAVVTYLTPVHGPGAVDPAAVDHVASCQVCRAEYEELAPLVALLRTLPPLTFSRGRRQ